MADSPKSGNQEFGDLLREAREDRGMSRRDLAEATGLSYPYISQLETGYRLPSPTAIQTLSRVLHVSLDAIFAAITNPSDRLPTAPRRRTRATPLSWVENGAFATEPATSGAAPGPADAEGALRLQDSAVGAGATPPVMPAAPTVAAGPTPGHDTEEVVAAVLDLLSAVPAENRLHALAQIQAAVVKGIIDDGIRQSRH